MPTDSAAIGDRMIAFVHVRQTGGTSVNSALQEGLGPRILWHAAVAQQAERAGRAYEDYVRATPGLYEGKRVITGHFPCDDPLIAHCPKPVVFAGVIRDPLERALSLYDHMRTRPAHPRHKEVSRRTLAQAIRDLPNIQHHVHSGQLMQLFRTDDRVRILRKIAAGSYLVGRYDHLDAFWDAMRAVLGIGNGLPHINRIGETALPAGLLPTAHQADFGEAMALLHGTCRTEAEFYRSMPRLIISPGLREAMRADALSPP